MRKISYLLPWAILALVGCGGNGSSSGGGGGGNGGALTEPAREAALRSIETKFNALASQPDRMTRGQALKSYMQSLNVFRDVNLAADGNIAAHFLDGPLFLVTNNRDVSEDNSDRATPSATSRATVVLLPETRPARLLWSYDPTITSGRSAIASLVSANGYTLAGSDSSLKAFEQGFHGDGVFYIDAHATQDPNQSGTPIYLQTSTTEKDLSFAQGKALYPDDVNNFHAVLGDQQQTVRQNGQIVTITKTCWYVDGTVISAHSKFGANSLVFINACQSNNDSLRKGFLDAGAGVYAGWTGDVADVVAVQTSKLLFDRLLGANQYQKPNPPQRPFDAEAIQTELAAQGFYQASGPKLMFTPKDVQNAILAPSIAFMSVDEKKKELTINGLFGADPGGNGKVTVDGTQVAVKSWQPKQLICDLPTELAGDVIVEVQKHKSNVVQLTEWIAHFRTTLKATGSLQITGTLDIHFRADVHSHRDMPMQTPIDPIVPFQIAQDTKGHWDGSGSGVMNGATATWSGSVDLLPVAYNPGVTDLIVSFGQVDVKAKTVTLALEAASTDGLMFTITGPGGTAHGPLASSTGKLDGDYAPGQPIPSLHLTLNNDFSIPGGVREEIETNGITVRLDWNAIVPNFPPDTTAARSVSRRLH